MHEHDSIHELHTMLLAGLDHFLKIPRGNTTWLFAEYVLSGAGSLKDPFLPQTRRQGDVDRIDLWIIDQSLVASTALGGTSKGLCF